MHALHKAYSSAEAANNEEAISTGSDIYRSIDKYLVFDFFVNAGM
jgi:hypothetical protein